MSPSYRRDNEVSFQAHAGKMSNDDALYSFNKTSKKPTYSAMKTPAAIRMATSMAINAGSGRPMTSNRAAGYSSRGRAAQGTVGGNAAFDPFHQGGVHPL